MSIDLSRKSTHNYPTMSGSMRNKRKVVVAGHICLDIAPVFPDSCKGEISKIFIPGKLVNVEGAQIHIGGSVGNTGLAMTFFGADVRLMGKVGRDELGEIAARIVKTHGISDEMIVSNESHTSYSIVLSLPGKDRIFLHHPGANDTFSLSDLDLDVIRDATLFHFGYPPLMECMYREDGRELTRLMQTVSDLGVVTSLDMVAIDPTSAAGQVDWEKVLANTLPYVDIYAPSLEETLFVLDRKTLERLEKEAKGKELPCVMDLERDVKPLADKLIQMGAKVVLIKCGEPGMYYRTAGRAKIAEMERKLGLAMKGWNDREGFERSYVPDRVLSANGAGDVAIAAFLTSLLFEHSLETCLKYSTAAGACCVTEYDTLSGLITFTEIQKKIDAGWKKLGV